MLLLMCLGAVVQRAILYAFASRQVYLAMCALHHVFGVGAWLCRLVDVMAIALEDGEEQPDDNSE